MFSAGCATSGKKVDTDKLQQIKKGETTQAEVISLLGEPNNIGTSDGADGVTTTLTYHYMHVSSKATNFIPYVGIVKSGYNNKNQMVMITIGTDGKVSSISSSTGKSETNTGLVGHD